MLPFWARRPSWSYGTFCLACLSNSSPSPASLLAGEVICTKKCSIPHQKFVQKISDPKKYDAKFARSNGNVLRPRPMFSEGVTVGLSSKGLLKVVCTLPLYQTAFVLGKTWKVMDLICHIVFKMKLTKIIFLTSSSFQFLFSQKIYPKRYKNSIILSSVFIFHHHYGSCE